MATRTFLNASSNWNDTNNWSGATVPVTGDTVRILSGGQDLDTNLSQGSVNNVTLEIGPEYYGRIGTAASPLTLGTGTTLIYGGARCRRFAFSASGTNFNIKATSAEPDAFILVGGTITSVNIGRSSRNVQILGGTITNVRALGSGVYVTLDSAAAVTNLYVTDGATVHSTDMPTNVYSSDGRIRLQGTAAGTATLIQQNGAMARTWYEGSDLTVTLLDVRGGVFTNADNGRALTLTNGNVYAGALVNLDNGVDTVTTSNALLVYGGDVTLTPSATATFVIGKSPGTGTSAPGGGAG